MADAGGAVGGFNVGRRPIVTVDGPNAGRAGRRNSRPPLIFPPVLWSR